MIRSVSALYAGHVLEGEGVGLSGTLADDRRYTNERFIQAFEIAKDTAQSMEALGYDILSGGEPGMGLWCYGDASVEEGGGQGVTHEDNTWN